LVAGRRSRIPEVKRKKTKRNLREIERGARARGRAGQGKQETAGRRGGREAVTKGREGKGIWFHLNI